MADNEHPNVASSLFAREKETEWADHLGIKCFYPEGVERCEGCPHYQDPKANPHCVHEKRPHWTTELAWAAGHD